MSLRPSKHSLLKISPGVEITTEMRPESQGVRSWVAAGTMVRSNQSLLEKRGSNKSKSEKERIKSEAVEGEIERNPRRRGFRMERRRVGNWRGKEGFVPSRGRSW